MATGCCRLTERDVSVKAISSATTSPNPPPICVQKADEPMGDWRSSHLLLVHPFQGNSQRWGRGAVRQPPGEICGEKPEKNRESWSSSLRILLSHESAHALLSTHITTAVMELLYLLPPWSFSHPFLLLLSSYSYVRFSFCHLGSCLPTFISRRGPSKGANSSSLCGNEFPLAKQSGIPSAVQQIPALIRGRWRAEHFLSSHCHTRALIKGLLDWPASLGHCHSARDRTHERKPYIQTHKQRVVVTFWSDPLN